MKKHLAYSCLALLVLSATAFGIRKNIEGVSLQGPISCAPEDLKGALENANEKFNANLFYDLGSRFVNTLKLEDVKRATTFQDLISEQAAEGIADVKALRVSWLEDNATTEMVKTSQWTGDQKEFLSQLKVNDNFFALAQVVYKPRESAMYENTEFPYYFTVIPHQEAEYSEGKEAFLNRIREKTGDALASVMMNRIGAGKIQFTVSVSGQINDIKLDNTSGYPSLDKMLMEVVRTSPEPWTPARNAEGEPVEQVLVLSFGQPGC